MQNNLIIRSGRHRIGISYEKGFYHLYSSQILEIEFDVEPGKVYRITKAQDVNGELVVGVVYKKWLIAKAQIK